MNSVWPTPEASGKNVCYPKIKKEKLEKIHWADSGKAIFQRDPAMIQSQAAPPLHSYLHSQISSCLSGKHFFYEIVCSLQPLTSILGTSLQPTRIIASVFLRWRLPITKQYLIPSNVMENHESKYRLCQNFDVYSLKPHGSKHQKSYPNNRFYINLIFYHWLEKLLTIIF